MLCCLSSVGYQSDVHVERQGPLVCQPAEVGEVHFRPPCLSPCHQSWSGNEGTDVGLQMLTWQLLLWLLPFTGCL